MEQRAQRVKLGEACALGWLVAAVRGGWASVACEGWGPSPALWAEKASLGSWVRGRVWEGWSVLAVGFGAAPSLVTKGGTARLLGP